MTVHDIKIRCNSKTSAPPTANIRAGIDVTANWKQWTQSQGPVTGWLYDCGNDFRSCAADKQGWFKIEQMCLWDSNLNSENWGTAIVLKQLKWSNRIPSSLEPGNKLIRHKLLVLHQANTPQVYAECAQLVVEGSGTSQPLSSFLKAIPGYASQIDTGITVDIYRGKLASYTPPGKGIWSRFQ